MFSPVLTGEKFPDLLKVAVIYGPNASGKSNLLKAFNVLGLMANREPSARETPLPLSPFRFDSALAHQPSRFEVHFIHDGIRYQFELAATPERVVTECLVAYPQGRETLLYRRQHTAEGESYAFGDTLEGGAELHQAWRRLTAPRVLFIAQAVANSSEEMGQLRAPFVWLKSATLPLLDGMKEAADAAQDLAQNTNFANEIAAFLREVDVPVVKIERVGTSVNRLMDAIGIKKTMLTHQTALGDANLSYEDESEGTKNLIGFWLPWSIRSSRFDSPRCILIADELDSSLHPNIVAALVAKHIHAEEPSQLIFSTHNTHLMDAKLLRRDQFWITERDSNGATQLRSIHDFAGREGEDIEKRYYEGRYRGLPVLAGR
ncbi:MAG TPA: ATP-binding protein [Rhodocyclaceae bacterium]|nr:ATP-binding protein [Rhodocyclaceae bacterium]